MAVKTAAGSRRTAHDTTSQAEPLKGWRAISEFLSQPTTVVQRWATEGMPVRRQGRYVETTSEELSRWLRRESGTKEPVHIATDNADLSTDLKASLSDLKRHRRRSD